MWCSFLFVGPDLGLVPGNRSGRCSGHRECSPCWGSARRLSAAATAPDRVGSPSLRSTDETWWSTVFSDTNRRAGELRVGQPLREQRQHLELARSEPGRVVLGALARTARHREPRLVALPQHARDACPRRRSRPAARRRRGRRRGRGRAAGRRPATSAQPSALPGRGRRPQVAGEHQRERLRQRRRSPRRRGPRARRHHSSSPRSQGVDAAGSRSSTRASSPRHRREVAPDPRRLGARDDGRHDAAGPPRSPRRGRVPRRAARAASGSPRRTATVPATTSAGIRLTGATSGLGSTPCGDPRRPRRTGPARASTRRATTPCRAATSPGRARCSRRCRRAATGRRSGEPAQLDEAGRRGSCTRGRRARGGRRRARGRGCAAAGRAPRGPSPPAPARCPTLFSACVSTSRSPSARASSMARSPQATVAVDVAGEHAQLRPVAVGHRELVARRRAAPGWRPPGRRSASASSPRPRNQDSRDSQRCAAPTASASPARSCSSSASARAASASASWSVR